MTLLILLIATALLLLAPLVFRPSLTLDRGGRIYAFCAIVVVPVIAGFAGLNEHIERTKTLHFCTSCHVMQKYGKSLHVDDLEHLAAQHWMYNRVPQETACFACHTNYTMYGDYKAKLRGLRHVYVQYLGKIPDKIELYTPYNNRECLHCHGGSRSFVEAVPHKDEMKAIVSNGKSCLNKGCHATVHDVDKIDALAMWPKPEEQKQ
ncbi:MAG TPA: NapC/NirT family cytochrome c [Polyangia bacterium]